MAAARTLFPQIDGHPPLLPVPGPRESALRTRSRKISREVLVPVMWSIPFLDRVNAKGKIIFSLRSLRRV